MTRPTFFTRPKSLFDASEYMPEGAVMTRDKAQALVEKIVKMSKADGISVSVDSGYQANIRFAANRMSTAGGVVNTQIGIESTFGKKHAVAVTNDPSDESLRRAVGITRQAVTRRSRSHACTPPADVSAGKRLFRFDRQSFFGRAGACGAHGTGASAQSR